MKHKSKLLLLSLILFIIPATMAWGAEGKVEKQSLENVFKSSTLLPVDYKGYAFVNGALSEYLDERSKPQNYIINGRVMVPLRLLPHILGNPKQDLYWNIWWDPKNARKVTLTTSFEPSISIVVTIGEKTMLVNKKPVTLEVPAQLMNNQMVLPLSAIGRAIDREVYLLDGMIIISSVPIDTRTSGAKALVAKTKKQLNSCRQAINYQLSPVAWFQERYYSIKNATENQDTKRFEIYQTKKGKTTKIALIGEPNLEHLLQRSDVQVDERYLFYPTKIGIETKLYRLDLATNQSEEVCTLSSVDVNWSLDEEGWFSGVHRIGKETLVVLHSGDWTMGSDTIFRLENKRLVKVCNVHSLMSFAILDTRLFYTSNNAAGALEYSMYQVDLAKQEVPTEIGLEGYHYGIEVQRTKALTTYVQPQDMKGIAIKDAMLFSLVAGETDGKRIQSIVRMDLKDNTQHVLPVEANRFWLLPEGILYRDLTNGSLIKTDYSGTKAVVLVKEETERVKIEGNRVYYTLANDIGLYVLDIVNGSSTKLANVPVDNFWINASGVYFVNNTYEAGIFKVRDNKALKLVEGFVQNCVSTPGGLLYNKRSDRSAFWAK